MRQSIVHFWRIHLAVLAGAAVATTVLTGSLLIGDSVRGSLRALTLDRLGRIDHALVSERFFREDLAADLADNQAFKTSYEAAVPAISMNGNAVAAGTRTRASKIAIHGIDQRFTSLFPNQPEDDKKKIDDMLLGNWESVSPPVVINASLQRELQIEPGDAILLSFERGSDINREFLFGSRNTSDIVQTLRLTLAGVIPDRQLGRFGLRPHQSLPLNAYVALPELQQALDQSGRVNAVYVSALPDLATPPDAQALQDIIQQTWQLEDLGLKLRPYPAYFSLESTEYLLNPHIIASAETAAADQLSITPILTYVANTITHGNRSIPYSTITALNIQFSIFNFQSTSSPSLAPDEILLNQWAAEDLRASVGDTLEVSYYVAGPKSELITETVSLRVAGVVGIEGTAADPGLIPDYPGIRDAEDIASWDAPFPIDFSLVRPRDEAYWDTYGATPKAFVSAETGRRLWRSRFGDLTAMWFSASPPFDVEDARTAFQKTLLETIVPESAGLQFQPVKLQGLQAATGATDFSQLFIGFSMFLIVSAALLVSLLFQLGIEQRVKEIGLLHAVGYPQNLIYRRFMQEGIILAGIGGLIGLAGAVAYAWLLLAGLRTWWLDAVGTPFLSLHMTPLSLVIGFVVGMAVVLFSIRRTIRRFGCVPVRVLLTGGAIVEQKVVRRFVRYAAMIGPVIAVLLILIAYVSGPSGAGAASFYFFGSGTCLLVSGLAMFSIWLRSSHHQKHGMPRSGLALMAGMGARDNARYPGRSMLCVALVGCACFMIVAVGANRRVSQPADRVLPMTSGTGGFSLMAESDIALYHDINTEDGRFELGFADGDDAVLDRSRVVSLRKLPGEDVSCLNLYQPENPNILGVPEELIARGGFQFQATAAQTPEEEENPWRLLEQDLGDNVIPAIGDYNSVLWILHRGLEDDVVVETPQGQTVRLRLVGLLSGSVFQSELLIAESQFLKHFPEQSGYGYFLMQTPQEATGPVGQLLEDRLGYYGFDVTSTTERIARYQVVENTYLSTFQTLGGFGLLLGTLGLGIILMRNALERSGELAVQRAFGFRRSVLSVKLLMENGFLLMSGLLIGTISALLAVAPHVFTPGVTVPWLSLTLTLALVLITGLTASATAVFFILRRPLLPVLKQEAGI